MTISFRMTATIATLCDIPALIRRSWKSCSSGFHRDAVIAAMYIMSRSRRLPPQVWRAPVCWSLSQAMGATPRRAAA